MADFVSLDEERRWYTMTTDDGFYSFNLNSVLPSLPSGSFITIYVARGNYSNVSSAFDSGNIASFCYTNDETSLYVE